MREWGGGELDSDGQSEANTGNEKEVCGRERERERGCRERERKEKREEEEEKKNEKKKEFVEMTEMGRDMRNEPL